MRPTCSQFWIMGVSISMGLPAVPNKGLATVGFDVGVNAIGSAMSIFGFVYFIQPIMMAMVQEMPVRAASNCVASVQGLGFSRVTLDT